MVRKGRGKSKIVLPESTLNKDESSDHLSADMLYKPVKLEALITHEGDSVDGQKEHYSKGERGGSLLAVGVIAILTFMAITLLLLLLKGGI